MSIIALHSTLNISETVRSRGLVNTKDHQWEMAYGVSNGHVTDDVTCPQKCSEEVRSAILATTWLLVMFTDAGAHFIYNIHNSLEYRQLRAYTHFSDTRVRDWRYRKKLEFRSAFPVSR